MEFRVFLQNGIMQNTALDRNLDFIARLEPNKKSGGIRLKWICSFFFGIDLPPRWAASWLQNGRNFVPQIFLLQTALIEGGGYTQTSLPVRQLWSSHLPPAPPTHHPSVFRRYHQHRVVHRVAAHPLCDFTVRRWHDWCQLRIWWDGARASLFGIRVLPFPPTAFEHPCSTIVTPPPKVLCVEFEHALEGG